MWARRRAGGFWQRWLAYAVTGQGGKAGLKVLLAGESIVEPDGGYRYFSVSKLMSDSVSQGALRLPPCQE